MPRRPTPPAGPFDRPGALTGDVGRLDEAYFRTSPRAALGSRAPGYGPSKLLRVYVFGDATTTRAGRVGHARPSKITSAPTSTRGAATASRPPPALVARLGAGPGVQRTRVDATRPFVGRESTHTIPTNATPARTGVWPSRPRRSPTLAPRISVELDSIRPVLGRSVASARDLEVEMLFAR